MLTTTFLAGLDNDPAVSDELSSRAEVELSSGIPFVSDAELEEGLAAAGVDSATADAIVEENSTARIEGLRAALGVLALITFGALWSTRRIPTTQPGAQGAVAPL